LTGEAWFDEDVLPRLERMVGGEALVEVLDLYFQNLPRRLSLVRGGVAEGDAAIVARALHDLKSSAGMVGACGLQRLAERLERMARDGDLDSVGEAVGELEREARRADEVLKRALDERKP